MLMVGAEASVDEIKNKTREKRKFWRNSSNLALHLFILESCFVLPNVSQVQRIRLYYLYHKFATCFFIRFLHQASILLQTAMVAVHKFF